MCNKHQTTELFVKQDYYEWMKKIKHKKQNSRDLMLKLDYQ